ncbi:MAG: glucose 1-dehydrogenase [Spirochaetota bacterium]|nr:MAG: glucose 1-dehydrogenase [Spirochaetota bacterium]
MKLKNKIALVTGSSRGIGKAIAVGFAREGANLIVTYRSKKNRAEEVVNTIEKAGRKAVALQVDIGKPETIKEFISEAWNVFGRIDILVNNAAAAYESEFLKMSFNLWRETLSLNLDGVMLCSQYTAQKMIDNGIKGNIICVTSINGYQVELNFSAYSVSKAGLDMLIKSMAAELGPYGIRVNGIAPSVVKTEIVPEEFYEKQGALFKKKTPLGRLGEVEDCVGPAILLASDESSYINGHIIVIDGGMSITQL